MRSSFLTTIVVAAITFTLSACGKPTAPESPDPEAYGTTITPDHHIPDKDQEESTFKKLEE